MSNTGKLVVFSGFSGSGKGTTMKELMAKHGDDYEIGRASCRERVWSRV